MEKKNYLLYDFMQVAGGAERVTLSLAEGLSGFQVLVSRCYPEALPLLNTSAVKVQELRGGWSQCLPRILESLWCFRFRTQCLEDAHVVIYSGFYAPMAVAQQRTGRRLYYCHTIPRFAYDLFDTSKADFPVWLRPVYSMFIRWLRSRYEAALKQMDCIYVNSENVRLRLKKYTGLDAEVIYPPVDTEKFTQLGDMGYYLSTARLMPNKRLDVIVEAFKALPQHQLVIVSGGPELRRLKARASGAANIRFTGWQTEVQMREWVGYARSVIYLPVDEDFGISPVEAMAAGKPVIGVAEGGLLETVVHAKTGWLITTPPTLQAVQDAVAVVEASHGQQMSDACVAQAARFTRDAFIQRFQQLLS